MFRKFWFYFYSLPVLFSLLFFSINLLYLWHISYDYKLPPFEDAINHCKDISNDKWFDDERTYQDKCIDEFMGGEGSFINTTFELFWVIGLLISIGGLFFIIPLTIYLLFIWRKNIINFVNYLFS